MSSPSAARCPSTVCWCSSSWLGLAMRLIFGRPFVKRFALCYRTVVCHVCVRLGSSPPKKEHSSPHTFWPMSVVAKRLDGSRCHLVRSWYGGRPRPRSHCLRWGPSFSPMQRGAAAPTFRLMSIVAKRSPISATAELLLPAALREAQTAGI